MRLIANTTVLDDGVLDNLKGGKGFDWFFAALADKRDLKTGEEVDATG